MPYQFDSTRFISYSNSALSLLIVGAATPIFKADLVVMAFAFSSDLVNHRPEEKISGRENETPKEKTQDMPAGCDAQWSIRSLRRGSCGG